MVLIPRKESPIMKKFISVLMCAVLFAMSLSIAAGAYSLQSESQPALEATFAKFKYLGDINHDGTLTASDARGILRYSVDLDPNVTDTLTIYPNDSYTVRQQKTKILKDLDIDKDNNVRATDLDLILDLDRDGIVTAIDARIILRASASLENIENYRQAYLLALFNDSINNVKVPVSTASTEYEGCPSYYYGEEKKTEAVNITNEAALNSFSTQMNNLISTMGESEEIDLATQLREDVGVPTFSSNANPLIAYKNSTHIPVYPFSECSFLTDADVKSITFNPSASYNFVSRKADGTVCKEYNVDNLYVIEVTVKDDVLTAANYPADLVNGTHAGKVFDLPSKETVVEAYTEIQALQEEMNSYRDSSNWLTNAAALEVKKFVLNVDFTGLNVSGSKVKLYINPATGLPVGMDYELRYDLNVNMYMDINLHGGLLVLYKDVVVSKQNVKLVNKLYTRNSVYIPKFS